MTRAAPGDRIIVRSGRVGGHDRDGEVLEAMRQGRAVHGPRPGAGSGPASGVS